jgi:ABC-2 type transport system ATP-binding protein
MMSPSIMGAMIELRGVTKSYRRFRSAGSVALDGITLRVGRGECLGVLGPNGAGKTTLLALLLGFLRPSSGFISVEGAEPCRYARESGVSYLPESIRLAGGRPACQVLCRLGILDGLGGAALKVRVAHALDRVGLTQHAGTRVNALSKGSLQRLAIAQLLLRPRRLILLDEPLAGLDPFWRGEFRHLLSELRREDPNRTIIIASHDLPEVERIAGRAIVLTGGLLRDEVRLPVRGPCTLEKLVCEATSPGSADAGRGP